jgi:hypothetical protein
VGTRTSASVMSMTPARKVCTMAAMVMMLTRDCSGFS